MPNPRGNPGNKGGGRKSAYQEFLDAQWHNAKWMKTTDFAKLEKRINSGKFSVRDMYLYKAMKGNDRLLARFGDKILPDISMMIGASGNAVEVDLVGEALKRVGKYEAEDEDEEEEPTEEGENDEEEEETEEDDE